MCVVVEMSFKSKVMQDYNCSGLDIKGIETCTLRKSGILHFQTIIYIYIYMCVSTPMTQLRHAHNENQVYYIFRQSYIYICVCFYTHDTTWHLSTVRCSISSTRSHSFTIQLHASLSWCVLWDHDKHFVLERKWGGWLLIFRSIKPVLSALSRVVATFSLDETNTFRVVTGGRHLFAR